MKNEELTSFKNFKHLSEADIILVNLCDQYGYDTIDISNEQAHQFIKASNSLNLNCKACGFPAIWKIIKTMNVVNRSFTSHSVSIPFSKEQPCLFKEFSYKKIDNEWYVFNTKTVLQPIYNKYGV